MGDSFSYLTSAAVFYASGPFCMKFTIDGHKPGIAVLRLSAKKIYVTEYSF
jgi:hypothetical protein